MPSPKGPVSARWILFLALLCPLLAGAYYSGCNHPTIGFYSNYNAVNFGATPNAHQEAIALAKATSIKGAPLFIGWNSSYYQACTTGQPLPSTCMAGSCVAYNGSAGSCLVKSNTCAGESELECYLRGFLDPWVGYQATATGTTMGPSPINVELVLAIHRGASQLGLVGPTYLNGLVSDAGTRADFKRFYGDVHNIIANPRYTDSTGYGGDWVVSVGNEVNLYINDWPAYTSFIADAVNYITYFGTPTPIVGSSVTFYANGLYSNAACVAGAPCTPAKGGSYNNILTLLKQEQALIVTYYPVLDSSTKTPYHAMAPTQVGTDFPLLIAALQAVDSTQYSIVQEVGYPSSTDLSYDANASGEVYQQQFVTNMFTAWHANSYNLKAVLWWSLFDYGDITSNHSDATCTNLASAWGFQNNLSFKEAYCTMGLVKPGQPSQGFQSTTWTEKAAMSVFRQQAPSVQNW